MFFYRSRRPRLFGTPRGLGWLTNPSQGYRNRFHFTLSKAKQMLRLYPSQLFYSSLRSTRGQSNRNKSARSSSNVQSSYKDEIIRNGYIRHEAAKNNYFCKNCGKNSWAVVKRNFLFWIVDMVYCEACKKPDFDLSNKSFSIK